MRNMRDYVKDIDSLQDLKDFAKKLGMKGYSKLSKEELREAIYIVLEDRFVEIGKTLGQPGKEGVAKLVWDQRDRVHRIKKQFRSTKSRNTLEKEANLQKAASTYGISPRVLEINTDKKFIVMEKMGSKTLVDIIRENKAQNKPLLSNEQQYEILGLFKRLDTIGIFHGDPNPYNFLKFPIDYHTKELRGKFGLIDYGFGKLIKGASELKVYNGKPNISLMTVGLLVLLKKKGFKASEFLVLYTSVNPVARVQFELE